MKIRRMMVALAGVAALVGCGMGDTAEPGGQPPAPREPPAEIPGEDHEQYGRSGGMHDEADDVVHIRQLAPETPDGQAAKSDGSKQCFCGFCQRTHAPSCL